MTLTSASAVTIQPPLGTAANRRRWLRRTGIVLVALLVVLVAVTLGMGYSFANLLLKADNSVTYDHMVLSVDGDQVVLDLDDSTSRPVLLGLTWNGGAAILSPEVRVVGRTVVRTADMIASGTLRAGLAVRVDTRVFAADPRSAFELAFDEVTVNGELGDLPAWYVPPIAPQPSTIWVIAVHGLAATRTETLRAVPIIEAAGMPVLAISYRNDPGAAASPDGRYHFGDTEWRDVQAAIEYARGKGATGVVLYGWSNGAAVSMTALRRMPPATASLVRGLVVDDGDFNPSAIIEHQGGQRSLPGFVRWTATRMVEHTASLNLDDLNLVSYAPDLKVPMLIFVDRADKTVPNQPAIDFANARPDLVTLVETNIGGHTGSWNADPVAYRRAVQTFLEPLA